MWFSYNLGFLVLGSATNDSRYTQTEPQTLVVAETEQQNSELGSGSITDILKFSQK